jgi:hypothetical protein
MTRLNARSSAALALVASLTFTGCGGTVDFSIDEMLTVDSNLNSGTAVASVDLAAEAGKAWKQRDKIDSVTVEHGEVTVATVNAGNVATTVSGSVWLLPDGATQTTDAGAVQVGSWTGEQVVQGHFIALTPSPALDAFVKNAFNGSGKFSMLATGAGAGGARLAVTLHVVLGAKLKWKLF